MMMMMTLTDNNNSNKKHDDTDSVAPSTVAAVCTPNSVASSTSTRNRVRTPDLRKNERMMMSALLTLQNSATVLRLLNARDPNRSNAQNMAMMDAVAEVMAAVPAAASAEEQRRFLKDLNLSQGEARLDEGRRKYCIRAAAERRRALKATATTATSTTSSVQAEESESESESSESSESESESDDSEDEAQSVVGKKRTVTFKEVPDRCCVVDSDEEERVIFQQPTKKQHRIDEDEEAAKKREAKRIRDKESRRRRKEAVAK